MPIDTASATPVADDRAVRVVEAWLRSEGLMPCGEWERRQYGPHLVWTVQASSATAVDENDLGRSFEHYFHEYNLHADAAAPIFPYSLEQYPCPGFGVYIYATVFL